MKLLAKEMYIRRKGISGWLSPKGEFVPVDYGKHAEVALELEVKRGISSIIDLESGNLVHGERLLEVLGYIKLVCRWVIDKAIDSYVIFPNQLINKRNITNAQVKWLEENLENMTAVQGIYVEELLGENFD